MDRKTSDEGGLLERAKLLYPWFPPGTTRLGDDPPDFVHETGDERIAIEVTRLFQVLGQGRPPRREVEAFHRSIMSEAEQSADAAKLPVFDVLVYFGDRPLANKQTAAAELVEFVRTHPVERCETFEPVNGLGVIRIARPLAGQVPRWTCRESGEEAVLTQVELAAVIAKKNADLLRYRARYDRAWLLICSTLFPLSASFSIPRNLAEWGFEFDFDRVLLLAEADDEVYSFASRRGSAAAALQ